MARAADFLLIDCQSVTLTNNPGYNLVGTIILFYHSSILLSLSLILFNTCDQQEGAWINNYGVVDKLTT